jgi:aspartyl protease family protein
LSDFRRDPRLKAPLESICSAVLWHDTGEEKPMRPIIAVSLLIGAVAVAAPNFLTRYMGEPGSRQAHVDASVAETAARNAVQATRAKPSVSAPRQVAIKAGRDGHFYVDANVNFRPVRLMVDTGATVVALRESDAATAGIRVRPADYTNPVQTANGTTNAAEATLDSVSVDDIEVRNVRALIIPDDQLAVSLLGGSFLHGVERFEIANGELILED